MFQIVKILIPKCKSQLVKQEYDPLHIRFFNAFGDKYYGRGSGGSVSYLYAEIRLVRHNHVLNIFGHDSDFFLFKGTSQIFRWLFLSRRTDTHGDTYLAGPLK